MVLWDFVADVYIPMHGGKQHDMDEHGDSGDVHQKLPEESRSGVGNIEGLRRSEHRHLHRPLRRPVRQQPRHLPSPARRRPPRYLPHRRSIPPGGPAVVYLHGREGREYILQHLQHRRRRHRRLSPYLRRYRLPRPHPLSGIRRRPALPSGLPSLYPSLLHATGFQPVRFKTQYRH